LSVEIQINHNLNHHKDKVRKLLTSEEGVYHRKQRSTEPESVFGQIKSNKGYYRFRHFTKAKVLLDFTLVAIAFNIGKLFNKGRIMPGFFLHSVFKSANVISHQTIYRIKILKLRRK
jgi:hypothetical protein